MEINCVCANTGSRIHDTKKKAQRSVNVHVLGFSCYPGKDCSPVQV